ncbi:MAG: hypothetical protein IKU37_06180 [Candidatus Gastranaerophilales bacterium]|nr:hypothetical protein [Candidatus Gastranaerophilales bacterium]
MTSISPLLQTTITQQAQTPNKTPKTDLTQKPDRVEINSGTNKKKVAKYVGIGIAIACAIATTAFLLTKGKTCLLEFNSKKAQKYAEDIQEKAKKLKNEVVELFNAGGNKVVKITDGVDCKIMEEIDSSGTLIRKSTFNLDGTLSEIELPTKKGADLYSFWDGELFAYEKNFQKDSEGNISRAKQLFFKDGKLAEYAKNFQYDSQENISTAKKLLFEDGKLVGYAKNFQENSKGNISAVKILSFEDGKLVKYLKNLQEEPEGNTSVAKEIEFTPGKPLINLLEFLKSFKKKT